MNSLHANECQVTFYSVKSFSFKLYIRKKREIERRKTINILFQNGGGNLDVGLRVNDLIFTLT